MIPPEQPLFGMDYVYTFLYAAATPELTETKKKSLSLLFVVAAPIYIKCYYRYFLIANDNTLMTSLLHRSYLSDLHYVIELI